MYPKDFLKNKNILIVMLYSAEMNLGENPYLSYNYIKEPPTGKYYCIAKALEYLGIKVDVSINYKSAIKKLTEKNGNYCKYFACLIFSGEPYAELPTENINNFIYNHPGAHLLGEFIKVIIQFWENGGRLGLFSDNAPFTFQVNLILEELEKKLKVSYGFRVGGDHEGKKILKGVVYGDLKKNIEKGTFNRNITFNDRYQRPSIVHNLFKMYEGNTVSFIIKNPDNDEILYFGKNQDLEMITDPEKIKPFIPLPKDFDRGFNSIFYCSNDNEGDIIIDGSYTKFFLEMDKKGTPRYLLNICSWLASIEKHNYKNNKNFKPKYIDIEIDWNAKFNKFMERKDKRLEYMKTLFVVISSASISNKLLYFNKIMELLKNFFHEDRGDAFYIWSNNYKKLEIKEIESFINKMEGNGNTYSSLIAEIANSENNNNFEHLIIISDGEVGKNEIDKSDQKFKEYNIKFSYISTFLIYTGQFLDESVGCPYTRNCPGKTYIVDSRGNQREQASLYKEDLNLFGNLNQIKSFELFKSKFEDIFRVFRTKCLGKNIGEKDDIKIKFRELKNNIKVPKDKINDFNHLIKEIDLMINGGLRNFQKIAC